MGERGIIMTGESVRAILAGVKTQTRRILKPQPREWTARIIDISKPMQDEEGVWGQVRTEWSSPSFDMPMGEPEREIWEPLKLPAGAGDRLWVREAWKPHSTFAGVRPRDIPPSKVFYAADDAYAPSDTPWRSPRHMPRWASRLTLTVTDVRVQRLQDISEEDARAEGHPLTHDGRHYDPPPREIDSWQGYGRASFSLTWSAIHGKGAWDRNPWVVAISFAPADRAASEGGPR